MSHPLLQNTYSDSIGSFKFLIKHSYVFFKYARHFPKPNGANTVLSVFIFLNLLKSYPETISQFLLAKPRQHSVISYIFSYNIVQFYFLLPSQSLPPSKKLHDTSYTKNYILPIRNEDRDCNNAPFH